MSAETLLQFDLKFDALKTYLEGFSTVINQHASLINTLQIDLETRLIETNVNNPLNTFIFKRIGKALWSHRETRNQ